DSFRITTREEQEQTAHGIDHGRDRLHPLRQGHLLKSLIVPSQDGKVLRIPLKHCNRAGLCAQSSLEFPFGGGLVPVIEGIYPRERGMPTAEPRIEGPPPPGPLLRPRQSYIRRDQFV